MTDELKKAARKLANLVEFDMNGTSGKGGNGGLMSDDTLRAAHEVHAILNRPEKHQPDTGGNPHSWSALSRCAKCGCKQGSLDGNQPCPGSAPEITWTD